MSSTIPTSFAPAQNLPPYPATGSLGAIIIVAISIILALQASGSSLCKAFMTWACSSSLRRV